MLSAIETGELLEDLCLHLGFCLPPAAHAQLMRETPGDAASFTDVVIQAEGLELQMVDKHLYRSVHDMVAAAFARSECDGV